MSFDAYGTSAAANSDKPKVDYNAMNQYVVDTAGLEERETLIGVVAGIVDLGTQEQPDAEVTFTVLLKMRKKQLQAILILISRMVSISNLASLYD